MTKDIVGALRVTALILLAIAFAVLIGACAQPQRITGTGQRAEPPPGHVDFCKRTPSHETCK